MKNTEKSNRSFTKLYDAIMMRDDLTLQQSVILCDIIRTHENGHKYYKSFATIGNMIKASHNTVRKALNGLIDKCEIERQRVFKEKREVGSYYTYTGKTALVVYNKDNGYNSAEMYRVSKSDTGVDDGVSNNEVGVSKSEADVSIFDDGVSIAATKETNEDTNEETKKETTGEKDHTFVDDSFVDMFAND